MGLAADALQPFIVPGLISAAGRVDPLSLADVIVFPKAAYYMSTDDAARSVLLDFGESSLVTLALASDCGRFGSASFQTVSTVPDDLIGRDTFPWGLVKMYYAAFYAGHSLIRAVGEGCSFVYKKHADRLNGLQPTFKIETGLYHCVLNQGATAVSLVRAQGMAGGAHEAFWLIFGKKIQALADGILSGPLTRSDAQAAYSRLDALLKVLGRKAGYSWLSVIRNDLQYRLQYQAWYPARTRKQDREALSRLAAQWAKDPMRIDIEAAGHRFGILGEFVACCAIVIALCRELTGRIAAASSEGAQSFVCSSGPVSFLNDIGIAA